LAEIVKIDRSSVCVGGGSSGTNNFFIHET
jgi:hypothetical protein